MKIDISFLIKFGNEENIFKLLTRGEVYMNTIKMFKEYDEIGIGDRYEGTTTVKNFKNAKLTIKLPNKSITFKTTNLHYNKHLTGHIGNIYSTYAISDLLIKRKKIHRIDPRMELFGSHCLLIKNVKDFTNRIPEELNKLGVKFDYRLVKYSNFKKNDHDLTLFDKSHLYSYQKEFRIVSWSKVDKPIKFNIGSIEKYAEIYKTDDLIRNLEVERLD